MMVELLCREGHEGERSCNFIEVNTKEKNEKMQNIPNSNPYYEKN